MRTTGFRRPLPPPVWLGGAGPLLWRQASSLVRSPALWIVITICVGMLAGPAFTPDPQATAIGLSIPLVLLAFIFLPNGFRFDFRQDVDRIEGFKTLPLGAMQISHGQLGVPVLAITMILVSGAVALLWHASIEPLLGVALLAIAPGAALLTLGVDNAFFLWYPTRSFGSSGLDVGAFGRQAGLLSVKGLALGAVAIIGVPLWLLGWSVTGSAGVATLMLLVPLIGVDVAIVVLVARAFDAFDVASDVPA